MSIPHRDYINEVVTEVECKLEIHNGYKRHIAILGEHVDLKTKKEIYFYRSAYIY
ncbi:MAG: hypothetical protein QXH10_09780 [Ignisphaera sp.]